MIQSITQEAVSRSRRFPVRIALSIALFATLGTAGGYAQTSSLRCVKGATAVSVFDDQQEVLRYNIVAPAAPNDGLRNYERSGYIHPIFSPQGAMVSGDFAPDHPHQHGLFVAWVNTDFLGRPVDFWNQHKGTGIVLHDRVIDIRQPTQQVPTVGFRVAVKHCMRDRNGSITKILDDVWSLSVERVAAQQRRPIYRLHFESLQTNVSKHSLVIDEWHYGGIGIRGRNGWFSKAAEKSLSQYAKQELPRGLPPWSDVPHRLTTDDSDDRIAANHFEPTEVILKGVVPVGDEPGWIAGIRVRSGASEAVLLPPVRLHPTKPYFSISPCVGGAFVLAPGETFRFKLVIDVFDEIAQ